MDENVTNHDNKSDGTSNTEEKSEENVKRLKTSDSGIGRSEESSLSSNTDQEMASASTSAETKNTFGVKTKMPPFVTFRMSPNTKNRNYRNSRDNAADDSEERDDPMGEEEETPRAEVSLRDEEEDDENEWEDYEEDEDEEEDIVEDTSGEDTRLFSDSPSSDDSTVILDGDNENDVEDHPLFKKEKPKHTWFAVNEIDKRQLGYSAKLQSRELFQRRCYGSLHCVKRLELMYKLEEHAGCVNSLNFHPDGTLLASGADDLKVVIWDWKIGKVLMKYKTKHRGNVFQSKFLHLSGDLHIASCARDGQVMITELM
jgi:WD repeat-containing protein 42A